MNVQGLNIVNSLINISPDELREGQLLFVEIVSMDPSGKGTVNIKGNLLEAVLETAAQPGDKFWAKVKEIDNQQLVLTKEINRLGTAGLPSQEESTAQNAKEIITGFSALSQDLAQAINIARKMDWKTLLDTSEEVSSSLIQSEPNPRDLDAKLLQILSNQISTNPSLKNLQGLSEQALANLGTKLLQALSEQISADPGFKTLQGLSEQTISNLGAKLLQGLSGQVSADMGLKSLQVLSEQDIAQLGIKLLQSLSEQVTANAGLKSLQGLSNSSSLASELQFKSIAEKLSAIIPSWSDLNGENGVPQIRSFLSNLGIGYERKLAEFLFSKNSPETELANLKDTVKAQLLEVLSGKESNSLDNSVSSKYQGLLEKITGQQLFLSDLTHSYIWLSLPLKENHNLTEAKIAIQGDRKKKTMDSSHCRIGVYVETLAFGEIGVDAYLSENTLSLRVLTQYPQEIKVLLQDLKPETITRFADLGLKLTGLDVVQMETNSEFRSFVSGEPQQGVDYYA